MRSIYRIDKFFDVLKNEWISQGVDLRFGQFLSNNGINVEDIYHMEEHEVLQKYFPHVNPRNYLMWGTYGKSGNEPLGYISPKDMDETHIRNVLTGGISNQSKLPDYMKNMFIAELATRIQENCKIEKSVDDNFINDSDVPF